MSKTWRTSEDAARDLTRINDFGRTNEEQLKADLSKGEPLNCVKETSHKFLDPRTGEEIDLRDAGMGNGLDVGKKFVSIGRGQLIEEYRQNSKVRRLKQQLQMIRPLGFRNDMIESYFTNHEEVEDAKEPSPTTLDKTDSTEKGKIVKGRRKNNAKNVLLSTLLEKKELNGDSQSVSEEKTSGDGCGIGKKCDSVGVCCCSSDLSATCRSCYYKDGDDQVFKYSSENFPPL